MLLKGWWWSLWPWTRKRLSVYRLVIPHAWKPAVHGTLSRLPPTITPELMHAVRLCRISYIRDSPPSETRVATFRRARFVHWIQQVSLPLIDKGESHKGLPILASTNELLFWKSQRVYLVVDAISRLDVRSLIDLSRCVDLTRRLVILSSFANTTRLC